MRTKILINLILCLAFIPANLLSQAPDLSKISDTKQKIATWASYCETLRLSSAGKNNFPGLQQAAVGGNQDDPCI